MKLDVLCVGPAYAEIIYTTKTLEVGLLPDRLRSMVSSRTSVHANETAFGCGGGGYIAALTCARLGLKADLVSSIGQDSMGCEILRRLGEAGVKSSSARQTTHSATSMQTLVRSPKDDYFEISSLNSSVGYGKSLIASLPTAKWLYLSGPFIDLGDLKLLLALAKKHDAKTMVRLTSHDLVNARKVIKLLAKVDICCFDRDDAEMLTHQPETRDALQSLRASGLKSILLLDDTKAAHALHDGFYYQTAQRPSLKRINETGMSEVFGPAFLASHLHGKSLESALDFGLSAARSVAHFVGSEPGIPQNIPHRSGKVRKNFI